MLKTFQRFSMFHEYERQTENHAGENAAENIPWSPEELLI